MRAVCLIAIAWAELASASPFHTSEAVTIRKKPGEKEDAVGKLPANARVEVLAEDGRWLRIRAGSVVGYLARTTVVDDGATPTGGATSQWSATRKAGGRLDDRLLVEVTVPTAVVRAKAAAASTPVVETARGAHFAVVDAATNPAWIRVRDDDGHDGWIARADVDNGASAVSVAGADLQGVGLERGTFARAPVVPFAIRGTVALGYRSIGMDFSSNAAGGLTNYVVDADAVAATGDIDVVMRRGVLFGGADGRLEVAGASPGIDYPGPTGPSGKVPFTTFATDVGVRGGIRARDAFDLAARVGAHYDAFLPTSVDNAGMLPRERLLGLTAGIRAEATPPRSRFGIAVRFDYLAVGSRAQTDGLQDGATSSAHAVWGGVGFAIQLDRRFAVTVSYDFERATTRWEGDSVREPGVTSASRIDTIQLVRLGLSAGL